MARYIKQAYNFISSMKIGLPPVRINWINLCFWGRGFPQTLFFFLYAPL